MVVLPCDDANFSDFVRNESLDEPETRSKIPWFEFCLFCHLFLQSNLLPGATRCNQKQSLQLRVRETSLHGKTVRLLSFPVEFYFP